MSKRNPNGYWTLERCMEDAARFAHKSDWRDASKPAYNIASRSGWLERCTEHMTPKENDGKFSLSRSLEDCKAAASQYESRAEWFYGDIASYRVAGRQGWLDECCAHMTGKGSDNDVVYIWRDEITGLHKIGITSDRLGEFRIGGFNKGVDPSIVLMLKVDDARAVEKEMLRLGTAPEMDSSIDGYTEFRRLTNAELGKAVSIAYEAALAA